MKSIKKMATKERKEHKEKSLDAELDGDVYLRLAARMALDPSECIIAHTGRLIWEADDGEYLAGRLKYYLVRVGAMLGRGVDPVWELDGVSADTAEYVELFNENRDGWSEAVERVWPETTFGDMVIFDRLIVCPPFRGQELGLKCLHLLMQIIGGVTLFVMRPMPLQYVPAYAMIPEVAKASGDQAADVRKLVDYYKRVGFREIPGSGQMILDPTMINAFDQRQDLHASLKIKRTPALADYRLPPEVEEEESLP